MIKGLHAMYYSSEPEALRSFFKDIFNLPATDVGQGWLIFDIPKCELGVHPTTGPQIEKEVASGTADISFYCENIRGFVEELKQKGVKFRGNIEDHGYGLVTFIEAPGDFVIQLYEAKY